MSHEPSPHTNNNNNTKQLQTSGLMVSPGIQSPVRSNPVQSGPGPTGEATPTWSHRHALIGRSRPALGGRKSHLSSALEKPEGTCVPRHLKAPRKLKRRPSVRPSVCHASQTASDWPETLRRGRSQKNSTTHTETAASDRK